MKIDKLIHAHDIYTQTGNKKTKTKNELYTKKNTNVDYIAKEKNDDDDKKTMEIDIID